MLSGEEFFDRYGKELDLKQREAVLRTDGPCLVQAVPGSGKTTVLVSRLGYMGCCLGEDLNRVLVVTFSREAAGDMKRRFRERFSNAEMKGRPVFCTIHSLALEIIRSYCRIYDREPFGILTNGEAVIRGIVQKDCERLAAAAAAEEAAAQISLCKNAMKSREEADAIAITGIDFPAVRRAYEDYKKQCREMDFDDLLLYAYRIIKRYPIIRAVFQEKYAHFCVDEAQDNSKIQNELLMLLAEKGRSLFLVGDEDQSIYGFRGADPAYLRRLARDFGEDRVIKLENNYRSCGEVLRLAGLVIGQIRGRTPKRLIGVKAGEGRTAVLEFGTMSDRDDYIAGDHCDCGTAAVLARNKESVLSIAWRLFRDGISFICIPGLAEAFDTEPLASIIRLLEAIWKEEPAEKVPARLRKYLMDRNRTVFLRRVGPQEAIRFLLDRMGFGNYIRNRWSERNLTRIYMKLSILEEIASGCTDLDGFLEMLEQFRAFVKKGGGERGIFLSSIHGAKGMEFDKVYLVDLVDKIFPSCYYITNGSTGAYEEEVRLLYVALTRARHSVEVLQVQQYRWGRPAPSTFEKEIEAHCNE
ncbi:MAG: ATP-dependent helicase [Firmicutes bacterium]|nr:ATP-dependent helicase [Bacillota bacterium]